MVDQFQKGGSYNEVNYGEYVIIDTIVNKHEPRNIENGIIYRRGLNYQEIFNPNSLPINSNNSLSKEDLDENNVKRYYDESTDADGNRLLIFNEERFNNTVSTFVQRPGGGAEYVGKIVGPKGEAPQISILQWEDFLEKYEADEATDLHKDSLEFTPPPGAKFDNNGNVINNSIVDVIHYGYLDILDAYGNIEGSYISIDFPYTVFKYHAESIEPYDTGYATYNNTKKLWEYTKLISEDDVSKNHPFFWQYDIKVPKGIRGQDLEKFDIDIDPSLVSADGNDILPGANNNNYRYYSIYRNYEKSAAGTTTKKYLDSWQRTIHKITDNGSIPSYPTIARNTNYAKNDRVHANGLGNHLCLMATKAGKTATTALPNLETYQRNKTFTDGTVTWQVVEDKITTPDLLTIHYTHGDNDEVKIRVVDDIICDSTNGRMYVKYSDLDTLTYLGENQSIHEIRYIDTPWVDSKGVSHTINRICIVYNTYNYDDNGNIVINANYSLDNKGNVVYPLTDSTGRRVQFIDEEFKFLDNIHIQNQHSLGQPTYFVAEYNDHNTTVFDEAPINEIASIQQYGDNIIILYSDPNVRRDLYQATVDYALPRDAYTVRNYNVETGNDDGNGNLYWINLGSIYKSNHIFTKFNSLAQLESEYPYGFDKNTDGSLNASMKDFAGWLATVDDGTGTITTYAYDYHNEHGAGSSWFKIQDLATENINPTLVMVISQPSVENPAKPIQSNDDLLNNNGYWFVISERAD